MGREVGVGWEEQSRGGGGGTQSRKAHPIVTSHFFFSFFYLVGWEENWNHIPCRVSGSVAKKGHPAASDGVLLALLSALHVSGPALELKACQWKPSHLVFDRLSTRTLKKLAT